MDRKVKVLSEEEVRRVNRGLSSFISAYNSGIVEEYERTPDELLDDLLLTVGTPNLVAKHRAAACDALGGFLEHGAKSQSCIRDLCLDATTWQRGHRVYLDRCDDAQKPMRQLLVSLVRLLDWQSDEVAFGIIQEASTRCLTMIHAHEDLTSVKPSMLTLELLLNKTKISSERIASIYRDTVTGTTQVEPVKLEYATQVPDQSYSRKFVRTVMEWARYGHIAPAAAKLLVAFYRGLTSPATGRQVEEKGLPLWLDSVRKLATQDEDMVEILGRHVLPELLRLDASSGTLPYADKLLSSVGYPQLLANNIGLVPAEDIRFCLLVFGSMGMRRVMSGSDKATASLELRDSADPYVIIILRLLKHQTPRLRVHALSLLFPGVGLPSVVLSSNITNAMLHCLPDFHAETDTRSRNEFIGIAKKYLTAIEHGLSREIKSSHTPPGQVALHIQPFASIQQEREHSSLTSLHKFVARYFEMMYEELLPSASYQRHLNALKVLKHAMLTKLVQTSRIDILTPHLMRMLFDLTIDSFDDVRAGAAVLLKDFPRAMLFGNHNAAQEVVDSRNYILCRAEKLMQLSGRADYADGVGRLYDIFHGCVQAKDGSITTSSYTRDIYIVQLLSLLEKDISVATKTLHSAVATAPIHGRLIALRYILGREDVAEAFDNQITWRKFHDRLVRCFVRIWDVVKPVLCIDSPEGSAENIDEDEVDIGIKDTLSYSWRTLKESSSLTQSLINNTSYGRYGDRRQLTYEDYKTLGDASFIQLAELRHRGAFSTVAQTFASCCIQCVRTADSTISTLPKHWYQETLKCIHDQASALTRRSAGLPAMVVAILAPYTADKFFEDTIIELQAVATLPPDLNEEATSRRLPQVHALNCIKEIFTNSRLAATTEAHLSHTIMIAVACLENTIWAVRNCGIMLFKALLTRLTGGSGSNTLGTGRVHRRFPQAVYNKYPELAAIVLHQLRKSSDFESGHNNAGDDLLQIQVCFPAMEIIDRVGVPANDRDEIEMLIHYLLGSPVWNVREKAARTLSTFAAIFDVLSGMVIASTDGSISSNMVHGYLLCMKYMLEGEDRDGITSLVRLEPTNDRPNFVNAILSLHESFTRGKQCPFVQAAYTDVLSVLVARMDTEAQHHFSELLHKEDVPRSNATGNKSHFKLEQCLGNVDSLSATLEGSYQRRYAHYCLRERLAYLKTQSASTWSRFDTIGSSQLHHAVAISVYSKISDGHWHHTPEQLVATLRSLKDNPPVASMSVLREYLVEIPGILSSEQHECIAPALDHLTYLVDQLTSTEKFDSTAQLKGMSAHLLHVLDMITTQRACTPAVVASSLRSRGALLRMLSAHCQDDWSREEQLRKWNTSLRLALNERVELPIRLAAATSIHSFRTSLRLPLSEAADISETLLPTYVALYDALIDDDEDIRDRAASVVSWIASTPGKLKSINSVAAAKWLLDFLSKSFQSSSLLFVESTHRITGCRGWEMSVDLGTGHDNENLEKTMGHVSHMFEEALLDDTSLFVEEKQNLYKDDVQEAERWSDVLRMLKDKPALREHVSAWASTGLATMLELAGPRRDGPLGWSSKLGAFTACMRVMCVTDVALSWKTKSLGDPICYDILETITNLLEVGERTQLHEHLLLKLRRLKKSGGEWQPSAVAIH